MNPWLTQEAAAAHVDDMRRAAALRHPPIEPRRDRRARGHEWPTRFRVPLRTRLGTVMIRVGGRLSGLEVLYAPKSDTRVSGPGLRVVRD